MKWNTTKKILEASYDNVARTLMRPRAQLERDLGEAFWAQQNERERIFIGNIRAFTKPAISYDDLFSS